MSDLSANDALVELERELDELGNLPESNDTGDRIRRLESQIVELR